MSESGALRYRCPCCGAHTLEALRAFETCALCKWEDDGLNEADPDRVVGGPNADYSLTEARENVRAYGIMFRPGDVRFARFRHPILGPAGETAIDRVVLRRRAYIEFAQFGKGRSEPLKLPHRLGHLLAAIRYADFLYIFD